MNDRLIHYLASRLREVSTYQALVFILTAFGARISEHQQVAIILGGMGIAGVLGAILPDRIGGKTRQGDSDAVADHSDSSTGGMRDSADPRATTHPGGSGFSG